MVPAFSPYLSLSVTVSLWSFERVTLRDRRPEKNPLVWLVWAHLLRANRATCPHVLLAPH